MTIDLDNLSWVDVMVALGFAVAVILGAEWYIKRRDKKGGKKWGSDYEL